MTRRESPATRTRTATGERRPRSSGAYSIGPSSSPGFTLATSAINVFYRDVNPVVQIGLQLWLYLTPVAYSLSRVSARFRWLFILNPLTAIVEGFRSSLVFSRAPDWNVVAISAAVSGVLFASAFVMFKRMDKYFADVI
jgi:ABC-type polysaccharide/polyol phosphate export permease